MTQKTKLDSIFRLSSEQLETRVNLTATAYGVDRHLPVPAPHVAQVKVAPQSYSVVMPHVKAAVAKTVTIPPVGQSGTFRWNWQSDHSLKAQIGNLQGKFTSVSQDGWNGEFSYKAKLAGGTSLTHTFNMSFSHDRGAEESTLTYDDAQNHLSTTFDEAAAVGTSAGGTSIQQPNGTVETSTVSGSTVVYTPTRAAQTAAPQYAGVPPVNHARPWQETATADGSTTVTSTKPRTLGSTLDDVKSLMTGLKASLDKSFRTVVPTVYQPSAPGRLSKMAAPAIARVHLAVGWNAMQAVQSAEVKAASSTALSTHLANQVQAVSTATITQASITITSFPYSYSYSQGLTNANDHEFTVYYNEQLINSFTLASSPSVVYSPPSYSGDNSSITAGTQGKIIFYGATTIGTYIFNCNGSSSTQLTINKTIL